MFINPEFDMTVTIILLIVSAIISLIVYAFSRKPFKALIIFSVLANLSFLLSIDSIMFIVYHIKWLKSFAAFVWPVINVILIIKYFKNKNEKNK
jgi:predicted ferric reductase